MISDPDILAAYHAEGRGILYRYRRHRGAWQPHLEAAKQVIREAMAACPGRQSVAVLGSGALLDVPLGELLAAFRRVVLVDVAHPWRVRLRAALSPRVALLDADLTGIDGRPPPGMEPPAPPDLPAVCEADLVISLNLMSQLAYVPVSQLELLGQTEEQGDAFAGALVRAHLDWLRRLPGRVCLVTDVKRIVLDPQGGVIGEIDPLYGLSLPEGGTEWNWNIAPIGEIAPDYAVRHRVRGYSDLPKG
ncbi:MAG: hypothetical protein QUV20_07370 [Oceanibaculum nanhaiense]|uniref:hypothetical protein n=1 Tax=Oceanibaculum nanhaiense TaxID=1909734 RepID=UPI0025A47A56|nr:hypothetical protein [Oceanibaculum nanhaiense]MDM7946139.1 hypothetical protein [Oceanibaculum nanhaiense]